MCLSACATSWVFDRSPGEDCINGSSCSNRRVACDIYRHNCHQWVPLLTTLTRRHFLWVVSSVLQPCSPLLENDHMSHRSASWPTLKRACKTFQFTSRLNWLIQFWQHYYLYLKILGLQGHDKSNWNLGWIWVCICVLFFIGKKRCISCVCWKLKSMSQGIWDLQGATLSSQGGEQVTHLIVLFWLPSEY